MGPVSQRNSDLGEVDQLGSNSKRVTFTREADLGTMSLSESADEFGRDREILSSGRVLEDNKPLEEKEGKASHRSLTTEEQQQMSHL